MREISKPKTKKYKRSYLAKPLINWHIRLAAHAVQQGGVIAYPTEAVYGLGCSPWDEEAIQKLLQLKRRPRHKGFIVVAANVAQLRPLVCFDNVDCLESILRTWPGPVTWILPLQKGAPASLTGNFDGLAVRVSAHPLVRDLCEICGPLVSTSANLSNTKPARSIMEVRNYFHNQLNFILPGKLGDESGPSEIRHGGSGEILRKR